jgi:hypothetical protein
VARTDSSEAKAAIGIGYLPEVRRVSPVLARALRDLLLIAQIGMAEQGRDVRFRSNGRGTARRSHPLETRKHRLTKTDAARRGEPPQAATAAQRAGIVTG